MEQGPEKQRYFLEISYKGTHYSGWQIQPNALTVQACLNKALGTIFRQPIETLGSGRTDAGVHASMQIAHADIPLTNNLEQFCYRLNCILPPDIALNKIIPVIPEANARFDALYRRYQYKIITRKDPFNQEFGYMFAQALNVDAMQMAANLMLEHSNYQAFSKVKTNVNNFTCHIQFAQFAWLDSHTLIFTVQANRFLRGMVRALTGTLLEVGLERMTINGFQEVLNGNHRSQAARALPAQGLCLVAIGYPDHIFL
jgi:tRNA pseudouridine38-40 synthase